jgi:hypothetical protein
LTDGGDKKLAIENLREERKSVFSEIVRTNFWGTAESVSGPGSTRDRADAVRDDLVALVRRRDVRTLLDAPCGDFHWMAAIDLPLESYLGVDIVPELIDTTRAKHGRADRTFLAGDLITDALPRVDLILCRDALVHFPLAEARAALANFRRSGSTWLLATHFTGDRANEEIRLGEWRPLNLERPPFNLPAPLEEIDERLSSLNEEWADKRLALWRLEELPRLD